MNNLKLFSLALVILLASCSTVKSVKAPQQIPQLPQIQAPVQEPSFTERMQNFLRGKLPEQKESLKNETTTTPNTKTQDGPLSNGVQVLCEGLMGRGKVVFRVEDEIFVLVIDCPLGKKV